MFRLNFIFNCLFHFDDNILIFRLFICLCISAGVDSFTYSLKYSSISSASFFLFYLIQILIHSDVKIIKQNK